MDTRDTDSMQRTVLNKPSFVILVIFVVSFRGMQSWVFPGGVSSPYNQSESWGSCFAFSILFLWFGAAWGSPLPVFPCKMFFWYPLALGTPNSAGVGLWLDGLVIRLRRTALRRWWWCWGWWWRWRWWRWSSVGRWNLKFGIAFICS